MKQAWWKVLTIVLLAYVLVVSVMTPLHPGINRVYQGDFQLLSSPQVQIQPGLNTNIHVLGYNSRFQSNAPTLKVWLANSDTSTLVMAENIRIESETHLIADFDFPDKIGGKSDLGARNLHLFVNNEADGQLLLNQAAWADQSIAVGAERMHQGSPGDQLTEAPNYFGFPFREILFETIRNLMLHVPMWFAMMVILFIALLKSIKFLRSGNLEDDIAAHQAVQVGLMLAICGLITGAVWARVTWGAWWVNDTKLNGAAVTTLIYFAYIILRQSVTDEQKRGRLSAVYSIFAYMMLLVFLWVIPRMQDSLHPGNGGNPAFSSYDLDNTLRMVFYPAVIAWILLGYWIYNVQKRFAIVKHKMLHDD